MDSTKAKKLIQIITLIWFLVGLALAGGAYAKVIPLDVFKIVFAVGFIGYAVAVTLLTRVMYGP